MSDRIRDFIGKYAVITAASLLFGAALSLLVDPNDLVPGGVSGLSILLSRLVPIETGTLFLLINIPIMILGAWRFGGRFIISTLYATVLVSGSANLFLHFSPVTGNQLLAALFGGAMIAAGMGLVLKNGATTGGTDIIVKCLRQRFPYLRTGTLFLLLDSVIIGMSGLVFGKLDTMLYSILSAAVSSRVLDLVLYGREGAKLIYIISDAWSDITRRILAELNVGVTHLSGTGAYMGAEKQVILCVVRKQNAYKVGEIVKQEDPYAFMIISSAAEIFGEGYKSHFGEPL